MSNSVCPWWAGYFLLNPIRSILQNPDKILRNYVEKDMHVLDIGCGMGFFSIPMAKLLGENGHVLAVDLQDKMIKSLNHRALKAGLSNKIKTKICSSQSLEIDDFIEKIDFALAFAVVHEVPDKKNLFREIYKSLKRRGRLLLVEPKGHVSKEDFNITISISQFVGFNIVEYPQIVWSRSVLLEKTN